MFQYHVHPDLILAEFRVIYGRNQVNTAENQDLERIVDPKKKKKKKNSG